MSTQAETLISTSKETSEVEELLKRYNIDKHDLEKIHTFGEFVIPRLGEVIAKWYVWLKKQPEFTQFFSDPEVLKHAQSGQSRYWEEFFGGRVDPAYVKTRQHLGQVHARINLPLDTYLAGMNMFLKVLGDLLDEHKMSSGDRSATERATTKLIHFDTAIVADTYSRMVNEKIAAQSQSLMEMSTPVTQIWKGILLLPLVGLIDSKRAKDVMNAALSKISETQSTIFIMDISGVGIVDTAVANHLIRITKATRLMGCESTISGVSPAVAQTIVELGVDTSGVKTTGNMRDALATAFQQLGLRIGATG